MDGNALYDDLANIAKMREELGWEGSLYDDLMWIVKMDREGADPVGLPPPPPPPPPPLPQGGMGRLPPPPPPLAPVDEEHARVRGGRAPSWSDAERSEEEYGCRSEHDEETAQEYLVRKDREWFLEVGVHYTMAEIQILEEREVWGWDKFARIVELKNALFFKDYPPWGLDMQGQPVCSERKPLLLEQDDKIDEEAERYILPDGTMDTDSLDEEAFQELKDAYPQDEDVAAFVSNLPPSRRGLWLERLKLI